MTWSGLADVAVGSSSGKMRWSSRFTVVRTHRGFARLLASSDTWTLQKRGWRTRVASSPARAAATSTRAPSPITATM
ncbi:Os05g0556350 [Oryza sativa Japonica Group]|uniref:Os05g0556350 protein n=1 Tax=Oryza sativa subsp. japonica TaxID=39947 RepID=A0A0P0WQV9_ORYSJ|nr:Os05g0556350 [Oryza sativa Japonica Group]